MNNSCSIGIPDTIELASIDNFRGGAFCGMGCLKDVHTLTQTMCIPCPFVR